MFGPNRVTRMPPAATPSPSPPLARARTSPPAASQRPRTPGSIRTTAYRDSGPGPAPKSNSDSSPAPAPADSHGAKQIETPVRTPPRPAPVLLRQESPARPPKRNDWRRTRDPIHVMRRTRDSGNRQHAKIGQQHYRQGQQVADRTGMRDRQVQPRISSTVSGCGNVNANLLPSTSTRTHIYPIASSRTAPQTRTAAMPRFMNVAISGSTLALHICSAFDQKNIGGHDQREKESPSRDSAARQHKAPTRTHSARPARLAPDQADSAPNSKSRVSGSGIELAHTTASTCAGISPKIAAVSNPVRRRP